MKNNEKKSYKIQSSVEGYTNFTLDGLVGIHGTSISDVVSFIIKSWIRENSDTLDNWGLGVKEYKRKVSKAEKL